jgi:hypothetical protein
MTIRVLATIPVSLNRLYYSNIREIRQVEDLHIEDREA